LSFIQKGTCCSQYLQLLVTLFCCSLFSFNQDDGDGDSDVESKDLDLPLRDAVHLRTDKKFDDAYISQKELGKYVSLSSLGCYLFFQTWVKFQLEWQKGILV